MKINIFEGYIKEYEEYRKSIIDSEFINNKLLLYGEFYSSTICHEPEKIIINDFFLNFSFDYTYYLHFRLNKMFLKHQIVNEIFSFGRIFMFMNSNSDWDYALHYATPYDLRLLLSTIKRKLE